MSPLGFEPTISAGERLQTDALDLAVTGVGATKHYGLDICGDSRNVAQIQQ